MSDVGAVEEIEAQNTIAAVIVHDLNKGGDGFTVDNRETELQVTGTVQRLVDQLADVYAKRPGKSYGRFEADEDNFPVQRFVRHYHVDGHLTFLQLTQSMMTTLAAKAASTASTGGHVFFAHINRAHKAYLLVAILTDELGASITDNKDVEDSLHLDIKGFRLAGRIDLTAWQEGSSQYLGFIKGRGQAKVSDYFKAFLGCDNSILAITETNTLIQGLETFASNNAMETEEREEFLNDALSIASKLAKSDTPFDTETFANELWPADPLQLIEVLSDPELHLNDGFVPDRRALRRLVKFSGKTTAWTLEFSRAALNEGNILFNTDETLTIMNLPEELKARLRREYEQQGYESSQNQNDG